MNIIRLNTLNDDKVIIKKEGGGNGGGCEEYDPLSKDMIYLDLSTFSLDDKTSLCSGLPAFAKYIDDNGETKFVPPFAYAGNDIGRWGRMNYYAVCGSLLVPGDNGDIPIKDAINLYFGDIPRITKEEFYHIPKIVNIDSMSSDEIKVVFEDLYSQLSLKYNIGDTFDDELSLYGYKEIILSGNSFTKVGQIYSSSEDDILIRLGSEEIPYSQGWGLIRSKVDGDIFYNPHFPG